MIKFKIKQSSAAELYPSYWFKALRTFGNHSKTFHSPFVRFLESDQNHYFFLYIFTLAISSILSHFYFAIAYWLHILHRLLWISIKLLKNMQEQPFVSNGYIIYYWQLKHSLWKYCKRIYIKFVYLILFVLTENIQEPLMKLI